jgi:CcmD family protein
MIYLGLAFSILWLVSFGYLFILDRQVANLKRRLDARDSSASAV